MDLLLQFSFCLLITSLITAFIVNLFEKTLEESIDRLQQIKLDLRTLEKASKGISSEIKKYKNKQILSKEDFELAQSCPPCTVYGYDCEICPYKKKNTGCLLDLSYKAYLKEE